VGGADLKKTTTTGSLLYWFMYQLFNRRRNSKTLKVRLPTKNVQLEAVEHLQI
jgi:hypothetical protein